MLCILVKMSKIEDSPLQYSSNVNLLHLEELIQYFGIVLSNYMVRFTCH